LLELVKKIFEKTIDENSFIDSVKNDLGLDEKNSKNLLSDITKEILPFIKKISVNDLRETIKKSFETLEAPIINKSENVTSVAKRINSPLKESVDPLLKIPPRKKTDVIKKPEKSSDKPDSYREPIE
jgi:hypothetical protein